MIMVDFESAQATRDGITMWMERIQARKRRATHHALRVNCTFFFFRWLVVNIVIIVINIVVCVVFVCEFLCAPAFGRLGADTNE